MLGLYLKELPENLERYADVICALCFVRRTEARDALGPPAEFLRKFIGLRRKGQGLLPAHLGQVLPAHELSEIDFGQSSRMLRSPPAEYERI